MHAANKSNEPGLALYSDRARGSTGQPLKRLLQRTASLPFRDGCGPVKASKHNLGKSASRAEEGTKISAKLACRPTSRAADPLRRFTRVHLLYLPHLSHSETLDCELLHRQRHTLTVHWAKTPSFLPRPWATITSTVLEDLITEAWTWRMRIHLARVTSVGASVCV